MRISDNKIQQSPVTGSKNTQSAAKLSTPRQMVVAQQQQQQQQQAATTARYGTVPHAVKQSAFKQVTQTKVAASSHNTTITNTRPGQRSKALAQPPKQQAIASPSQSKNTSHLLAGTASNKLSTTNTMKQSQVPKASSAQPQKQHQAVAASKSQNKDLPSDTTTTKLSSVNYAYSPDNLHRKRKSRAPFECIICLTDFKTNIPHTTEKCDHQVCRDCVRRYFSTAVKDPRYKTFDSLPCPSPGCSEFFVTDEALAYFFSKAEVKRWWHSAVRNAYITNKVNCPMTGCHGVFDVDTSDLKKCAFTECMECHRGFCIACQTAWHPGETRIVDDEEDWKKTLKKAEQSHWCRCPKCSRIVEKVSGCSTMRCYCGTYFCYRCGGASDDHFCRNRCQYLKQEQLNALRSSMFVQDNKKDNIHQKKKPRAAL